jgi:hypothetical protein
VRPPYEIPMASTEDARASMVVSSTAAQGVRSNAHFTITIKEG